MRKSPNKFLITFYLAALVSLEALGAGGGEPVDLLISGARIFTGRGEVLENAAIAISNGRIEAVVSGEAALRAKLEIDASGNTVLPGLIDAHVHLVDTELIADEASFHSFMGATLPHMLEGMLLHGVTTIRSAGDPLDSMLDLRTLLTGGAMRGPRLSIVGPSITASRGHPAATLFLNYPEMRERFTREVEKAEEGREAVRRLVRAGVDSIKVIYQGSHAGEKPYISNGVAIRKLPPEVLKAIVEEGHRHGLPVTCHTWDYDDALAAVIAGVDGINHGVVSKAIPDDRLAREMVARGTCYIPTLRLLEAIAPPLLPVAKENLRLLYVEGVNIVMGSDTPVGWTYPGVNSLFEIEFMVDAGMSPAAALRAATYNAARHIGRDEEIGSLAVGKVADLLIIQGNPLSDITRLRYIDTVIQAGEIVRRRTSR